MCGRMCVCTWVRIEKQMQKVTVADRLLITGLSAFASCDFGLSPRSINSCSKSNNMGKAIAQEQALVFLLNSWDFWVGTMPRSVWCIDGLLISYLESLCIVLLISYVKGVVN